MGLNQVALHCREQSPSCCVQCSEIKIRNI